MSNDPRLRPGMHGRMPPRGPVPLYQPSSTPIATSTTTAGPRLSPMGRIAVDVVDLEEADLLTPTMTVREALSVLQSHDKPIAALRLLAHALPRREAVWWGCLCLRAGEVLPKEEAALAAAEGWVSKQDEDSRRKAEATATALNYETPAGVLAMAAFWSGGTMGPVGTAVEPAANLLPLSVSNAVILSVVRKQPEKLTEKVAACVEIGVEVSEQKRMWK